MKLKLFALLSLLCALPLGAQTRVSPFQFNLNQIPNCALTSGIPTGTPIILAIIPSASGVSQFGCYTIAGVSVTPATATAPASITLPLPALPTPVTESLALAPGSTNVYALSSLPITGTLLVMRNGLVLCPSTATSCPNGTADYTLAGMSITFLAASLPQAGDGILAVYWH